MSSRMPGSNRTPLSLERFETSSSDGAVPTWEEFLSNNPAGALEFAGSHYPETMDYEETQNGRESQQVSPMSRSTSAPSSYSGFPQQQRTMVPELKRERLPVPSYPMIPAEISQPPPLPAILPEMKVAMRTTSTPDLPTGTQVGRWTKREHELFLEGLQRFGKSWKKISSLVHTRTLVQIRTHAQKYLQKQSRAALKEEAKAGAVTPRGDQTPPDLLLESLVKLQPQNGVLQTETNLPQLRPRVDTSAHLSPVHIDTPRVLSLHPCQWKPNERSGGYVPLLLPGSVTRTSTQIITMATSTTTSPRSAFQLNPINRLDQLLQEDTGIAIPGFVDEQYTSPTAIEDDLLRPLYTAETQWAHSRLTLAEATNNYANKRRRLDRSSSACASTAPTLAAHEFEPLPAPSNLSSPINSPRAHSMQQSAAMAALLAAHETDEADNYPSQWL